LKNIVVLISGGGTNLQSIIDGCKNGTIHGRITGVISSSRHAYGLTRAKNAGIETKVISKYKYPIDADREAALLDALNEFQADIIVLAGYLSILPKSIIAAYRNRIVNIHPSLIPSFCGDGFYGLHVHEKVLEYGAKVSGATVHFVDEGTDTGPIILQKSVPVMDDDTPEALQQRVLVVEHELLPRAVELLCTDCIKVDGRKVILKEEGEGK